MEAELPEGYWTGAPSQNWVYVLSIVIVIAVPLLILGIWLWIRLSGPHYAQTVEFQAPDGLTPVEASYILKGNAYPQQQYLTMIPYYAYKGYLSIQNPQNGKYYVQYLRNVGNDQPPFSQSLFTSLFFSKPRNRKKKRSALKNEASLETSLQSSLNAAADAPNGFSGLVSLNDLPDDFCESVYRTPSALKKQYSGAKQIYDKRCNKWKNLSIILLCLYMPGVMALLASTLGFTYPGLFAAAIVGPLFMMASLFMLSYTDALTIRNQPLSTIFWWVLYGIFAAAEFILLKSEFLELPYQSLRLVNPLMRLAVFLFIVSSLLVPTMKRRTDYSARLAARIKGFRRFIETAQYQQLKMLSDQNPGYFFNVLPYAYVFGLSTQWMEKFMKIGIPYPSWYSSYDPSYSPYTYDSLMTTSYHSFRHTYSSYTIRYHSSVGGSSGGHDSGSSGGSFSGGGVGGGGGGAW